MQLRGLRLSVVRRLGCLVAGALWLLGSGAVVRADEASGTWSGTLEGRGNYYWERSTRVIVPEAKLALTAPNGLRMHGEYLVDVISSASISAGAGADNVFTELRHGIGAGVGKELDLGSSQLDLSLHGTYSTESDYKSIIYGLDTALSFNQRNTKISLGVLRVSDDVYSNAVPTFSAQLHGLAASASVEQLINPTVSVGLSYQFVYLSGYLGNPYRNVLFAQGAPAGEAPPHTRFRNNASAHVAFYIPSSRTALHILHRAYIDSWDVAALTPELRVYQELGPDWLLRAHYRFYIQTRASFARESGRYPGSALTYTGATTNDPKLLSMRTHTLGLAVEYRLGFLADTVLDFAREAYLDLAFDRYWSTSTFGNGVIATAGGRLPF